MNVYVFCCDYQSIYNVDHNVEKNKPVFITEVF